ncbi:HAD-IB family hydrolase [Legionella drancourtii]|uniref:Putative HAD family hydrolase n=1 Tax=Legionella drancourtii LLAP12 TaxID=658187 RepID=G9EU14_9GAMM|nr:HAD-IB family hydrolase [Legionella drancourtii]EHL29365.1 putative HAD family hydrolase [Legionella drancourtii LLAP12]
MQNKIDDFQTIALFDFDGTITTKSTTTPFLKFISGPTFFLKLLPKLPNLVGYQIHLTDLHQLNTSIAQTFFKGLSREFLYEEGEKFSTQIIPSLVKNTAYKRIKWHKEQGHYCILATAAFNIYIDYWAKMNGFDDLVSTKICFNTQGLATGNLDGQSCYGAEKLKRVLELIGTQSRLIYAYGDSSGDKAILDYATYPYYKIFK